MLPIRVLGPPMRVNRLESLTLIESQPGALARYKWLDSWADLSRVTLMARKSGITGRLDCDEARNDERLSKATVVGLRGPAEYSYELFLTR
jgi:hypothetical protein